MRLLLALTLALALLPARAESGGCIVDAGVALEGDYTLIVPNPAVGEGRAYSATPPVELTIRTSFDIPLTYTQTITRLVLLPPPPHLEVFTQTIYTHRTIYTDTTELLGYAPRLVSSADLGYTFRASQPFRVWDCPGVAHPHIFLPRV